MASPFEVNEIFERRYDDSAREFSYYVSWKGFPPEDNAWEGRGALMMMCPDLVETFDRLCEKEGNKPSHPVSHKMVQPSSKGKATASGSTSGSSKKAPVAASSIRLSTLTKTVSPHVPAAVGSSKKAASTKTVVTADPRKRPLPQARPGMADVLEGEVSSDDGAETLRLSRSHISSGPAAKRSNIQSPAVVVSRSGAVDGKTPIVQLRATARVGGPPGSPVRGYHHQRPSYYIRHDGSRRGDHPMGSEAADAFGPIVRVTGCRMLGDHLFYRAQRQSPETGEFMAQWEHKQDVVDEDPAAVIEYLESRLRWGGGQ